MASLCSGCGLAVREGAAGCQALFEGHAAREYELGVAYPVHRLVVDTYCLQHPERYCVSAKSLAAHLTGQCWAFEHGGHPAVGRALQRWLDGSPSIQKPEIPSSRGALTIAEVQGAPDARGYARAVERWARSTWEAYAALQPLARRWIEQALARR